VLHFQYTGTAPTNAELLSWAQSATSFWQTHMSPEQPSPFLLKSAEATDLTSNTSGQAIFEVPSPYIAGTRGDDVIGANTAFLISYPIQSRYRGGHPRNYLLVGGNADNADAATWSSAFVTEVQGHWNAFTSALGGAPPAGTTMPSMCMVSYHSKYRPIVPPTNYPAPIVYSYGGVAQGIGNAEMASARRRIGRRK
jgi:hypothetical protein